MTRDPNALMREAEAALAQRRHDVARAAVREVLRAVADHPQPWHLLGIIEHRAGKLGEARSAFVRALALAPGDADINANYANLLGDAGEHAAALDHYRAALTARPDWPEVEANAAEALHRAGHSRPALAVLDALIERRPRVARLPSMKGTIHVDLGEVDAAAAAFDAALALEPARPVALSGRAWTAAQRGEADAVERYRRALAARTGDRDLRLGLAEALEAAGDSSGLAEAEALAHDERDWVPALALLARMRWEAGEGAAATRGFDDAIEAHPGDAALHRAHWAALAEQGRPAEALAAIDAARARIGESRATMLVEAGMASEAGDDARADRLYAALGDAPDAIVAATRFRLRRGDPAAAAASLEPVAVRDLGDVAAWAYLDLAWRLLGDRRHEWLSRQEGLWRAQELGLDGDAVGALGRLLADLHRTRHSPQGQSLRHGTQTRGALFGRREPEIARLRAAIDATLARYLAMLPPHDPRHPLLALDRTAFAITGSWSVRLGGGGFHVHHIHPQGRISSALYLDVPPEVADEIGRPGWLEVGSAPRELGLALDPIGTVKPAPGRLALFPSYFFHGTRPFRTGSRMTVAFDVAPVPPV